MLGVIICTHKKGTSQANNLVVIYAALKLLYKAVSGISVQSYHTGTPVQLRECSINLTYSSYEV